MKIAGADIKIYAGILVAAMEKNKNGIQNQASSTSFSGALFLNECTVNHIIGM
jgi:hypothetical protein